MSHRALLEAIRTAQDLGVQQGPRFLSTFATALSEIEQGRKASHWIWYVWPSLLAVRPNVQLKQFLLPDLSACTEYLRDPVLRERLLTISRVATAHLQRGVSSQALFGSQHKYDAPKFHETMTAFALSARIATEPVVEEVCIAGALAVAPKSGLHEPTMRIFLDGGTEAEILAARSLTEACGMGPAPGKMAPPPSPLSAEEAQEWAELQRIAGAQKKQARET